MCAGADWLSSSVSQRVSRGLLECSLTRPSPDVTSLYSSQSGDCVSMSSGKCVHNLRFTSPLRTFLIQAAFETVEKTVWLMTAPLKNVFILSRQSVDRRPPFKFYDVAVTVMLIALFSLTRSLTSIFQRFN